MNALSLDTLGSITEITSGKTASSHELRARIAEKKHEFQNGSIVALIQGNSIDFFVNLLAIWESGGCAVPLDPKAPLPELEFILSHSGATQAISSDPIPERLAEIISENRQKERQICGMSLILYTSGSTGEPKGVVHDRSSLEARLTALAKHVPLSDLARTLCLLPTHFGHGLIGNSLLPLLNGCGLVIANAFDFTLASRLGELVDRHGITFLSSVPALWEIALATGAVPKQRTLKRIHCASAPLSPELRRRVREWAGDTIPVKNVYGLTEFGSWISSAADSNEPEDSLGQGWSADFRVVRENGTGAAPGETGRIWIRSASLMKGYLHREDLTHETCRDGWFDSGDAGALDSSGRLFLRGRLKTVINRAGMKVYPEEVDRLLISHPKIKDACAFSVPDPLAGEAVAAAVVLRDSGEAIDLFEIETWCRDQVSGFKVPTRWFIFESLSRNSRGKISRTEIAKLALARDDEGGTR